MGSARLAGFTLIEQLMCVVIIAILTTISISCYQGALDNSDIKYASPAVAGRLEQLRKEAEQNAMMITVEFKLGEAAWTVKRRKGSEESTGQESLEGESLIRRRLRFLRYQWPDAAKTPATFTFLANKAPQGGTVYFGTGRAETAICIKGDRVYCEHGVREPR